MITTPPNSQSTKSLKEKILTQTLSQSIIKNWKYLKYGLIALGIFLLAWSLSCIPRYFINTSKPIKEDYALTGTIGDTYGGLLGPPIAFIAAILTFAAFWVQYRANQQQKKDIVQQREDWEIERFETRFFELLKIHKENVSEMELGDKKGRHCFNSLFYEFRTIYRAIYKECGPLEKLPDEVNPMGLAYLIFYYGIGPNSERSYVPELSMTERHIFESAKEKLVVERDRNDILNREGEDVKRLLSSYKLFDGHSTLLGSYYRHLFQTAKYVIKFPLLKPGGKYQYIRTLRDQLSSFEQLMLYYNGTTWFPEEWETIFTEYRFIKNIPLEHCLRGVTPIQRYGDFMVKLWLTEKKRLFEGQGDIKSTVHFWILEHHDEFINLRIHKDHIYYQQIQNDSINES